MLIGRNHPEPEGYAHRSCQRLGASTNDFVNHVPEYGRRETQCCRRK
jgi:hypothetical protein